MLQGTDRIRRNDPALTTNTTVTPDLYDQNQHEGPSLNSHNKRESSTDRDTQLGWAPRRLTMAAGPAYDQMIALGGPHCCGSSL